MTLIPRSFSGITNQVWWYSVVNSNIVDTIPSLRMWTASFSWDNKRLRFDKFSTLILIAKWMSRIIQIIRVLKNYVNLEYVVKSSGRKTPIIIIITERPPNVMKLSQRWNTLQICPRQDSNSGGSELWSNALPVRPRTHP